MVKLGFDNKTNKTTLPDTVWRDLLHCPAQGGDGGAAQHRLQEVYVDVDVDVADRWEVCLRVCCSCGRTVLVTGVR